MFRAADRRLQPLSRRSKLPLGVVAAWIAVPAWAAVAAARAAWTTDDAFITFRYAANWIAGLGLVFNEGERVEGYTNFLWTVWCAVGMRAGVAPETWANVWGIVAYVTCVLLLLRHHRGLRLAAERERVAFGAVPVAAIVAAFLPDWQIYATSGLETSAFTLLLVVGYYLAVPLRCPIAQRAAAGLVFAAAALTRPDGVLPALVVGAYVVAVDARRLRAGAAFAGAFAVPWFAHMLWRVSYYGDWLPNTFYAKSGGAAYWGQGLRYLQLFGERYAPVLLAAVVAAVWLARTRPRGALARHGGLALALACVYTLYVVRVGGDFMFARFLIPALPFFLIAIECAVCGGFARRPRVALGLVAAGIAFVSFAPAPVTGERWRYGVADEWRFYDSERCRRLDRVGEVLGNAFAGLPVRVAFYGAEARKVYRAGFPVAIESHAGLTDRDLARRPVERRGRPGHEKMASERYLLDERRAHFTFSTVPVERLELDAYIPNVIVDFGDGVYGRVLNWDPEIMRTIRARGARMPRDFLRGLDAWLARIDDVSDDEVRRMWINLERFYFDSVEDPARRGPFERRLGNLRVE